MPGIGKGIGPVFGGGGVRYPSVLDDGNTVAYYDSLYPASITKDASDRVSVWKDRLGSGRDLLQATAASQPLWGRNGIYFDGTRRMKANAFTLAQPETVYIVFSIMNELSGMAIFDGNANDTMELKLATATTMGMYAGTSSSTHNTDKRSNNIVRCLFSGANSKFYLNGTNINVSAGTASGSGFTLGGKGVSTSFNGRIIVRSVIIRKIADNAEDESVILSYLNDRFGQNRYPGKMVFTFDDTSSACYTVLAEFARYVSDDIKGTFYVCGSLMDTAGYTTSAQILELHSAGHDIQCHGYAHYHEPTLSQADLLKNITDNNTYFSGIGLSHRNHHAYPYGEFSEDMITWLRAQGERITGRGYSITDAEAAIVSKTDDKFKINSISHDNVSAAVKSSKIKEAADSSKAVVITSHGWSTTYYEYIALAKLYGCKPITISELYNWMNS